MSASSEACCTCATVLSAVPPQYDETTEKLYQHQQRLGCCGRAICARCIRDNPRFTTYCPFCQFSFGPSPLPQGTREPPSYSPPTDKLELQCANLPQEDDEKPPPYSERKSSQTTGDHKGKIADIAPDVLHFVDPNDDSITSLSLRYGVPGDVLRRTNGLYADHLLAARRTILIPGEYYKGRVSLSPRPLGGEEEEIRKGKVRRFMVACKVAE